MDGDEGVTSRGRFWYWPPPRPWPGERINPCTETSADGTDPAEAELLLMPWPGERINPCAATSAFGSHSPAAAVDEVGNDGG